MSAYQVSGSAARLDRLPILPFHRRLLFLVGAGLFFDAFDIYLANSVLGALVQSGWSTLDLNAVFLSATSIGMLVGSVMAGILGDRYGRKFSYQFNLALFGLASLGCAIAPSMNGLIAARFLCGVGLGAELVIGYGLLSEFVPPSHRGRWAALLSCMAQFGLFASTLMSWLLIPTFGWRAMFILAGIGALVVFVARKVIPESPRWLEGNGRVEEAQKILSQIEASAGQVTLPPVAAAATPSPVASSTGLFDSGLLRPLGLGALTQVIQSVAIYGFVAWVPTFLVKQGQPDARPRRADVVRWPGRCAACVPADRSDRAPSRNHRRFFRGDGVGTVVRPGNVAGRRRGTGLLALQPDLLPGLGDPGRISPRTLSDCRPDASNKSLRHRWTRHGHRTSVCNCCPVSRERRYGRCRPRIGPAYPADHRGDLVRP
jgi:MFS family permease